MNKGQNEIKIVIGAGEYVNNLGWIHTQEEELNLLDEKYVDYFIKKYCISSEKFMAAFNQLKKANNQKKYKRTRQ